jgi:hypothetical protein
MFRIVHIGNSPSLTSWLETINIGRPNITSISLAFVGCWQDVATRDVFSISWPSYDFTAFKPSAVE